MSKKRIHVSEGIDLNIIKTDQFKTNYISVNFILPLSAENAAYTALLPAVLLRGTKHYPDMAAISRRSDMLYSTSIHPRVYKRGEAHIFGFSAYVLDNSYSLDGTDILGGALELMSEILFEPVLENGVFRADYVESEKQNLIDNVNAKINDKIRYAVQRCQEEMCAGERYHISETGSVEEIAAISPASLYGFYQSVIGRARVEIYYVGRGDGDELAARLRPLFSRASGGLYRNDTQVIRAAADVKEITEDQPVAQGKLSLGFRTGCILSDADYHVFSLFLVLYANGTTSKLFMNVREKLSLCYYCQAIPEPQKGIAIVTCGIETANKQKAQDEILLQLDAVRKGDFTDEELESAKKTLINSYRELGDSPASLESWYMGRDLSGRSDSPDEAAAAVIEVTRDQIAGMAERMSLDTVYFMRGTLKADEEEAGHE